MSQEYTILCGEIRVFKYFVLEKSELVLWNFSACIRRISLGLDKTARVVFYYFDSLPSTIK